MICSVRLSVYSVQSKNAPTALSFKRRHEKLTDADMRGQGLTVVCSVTWPLNANAAGVDLALIQTSLLFHSNAASS